MDIPVRRLAKRCMLRRTKKNVHSTGLETESSLLLTKRAVSS